MRMINPVMRAKMKVTQVVLSEYGEKASFTCIGPNAAYPNDGLDEDNTFAKFSPSGDCTIQVANPALFGVLKPGMKFYLDFTEAE